MLDILRLLAALLLAPLTLFLMAVCGYLALLGLGAWFFRARRGMALDSPPRFAVLIPAHNESAQIADVVHDAQEQDYPADAVTVFVIADNCNDDTAARATAAGAEVFERHDLTQRGKGQALDWCLRTHADVLSQYDLIALVDADMHMDAQFLRELAGSFSDPATQVVQSLNTVANPSESWRAAFGFMGFTTVNFTRPAGRRWLGGTAELRGSGMAFRAPLLLKCGWPAHSIAEDVEFSKRLFLDNILVEFNPHARVTSAIPLQAAQAQVQQSRWEGGKLAILKSYLPLLLAKLARKPGLPQLDAVLDLLVPPQTILFAVLLFALGLAAFVHPVWALVILACVGGVAFCIASGLLLVRAPAKVWMYLLALPLFLAWKVPLYAGLLLKKSAGWQRTPRDNEL